MSEWTLQKFEYKEEASYTWVVTDPNGWFTDFDTWQEALTYMEDQIKEETYESH